MLLSQRNAHDRPQFHNFYSMSATQMPATSVPQELRTLTRHHAKRPPSPSGDLNMEYPPKPRKRKRMTEEKLSAGLRNFHITNTNDMQEQQLQAGHAKSNEWFFLKKPAETLDEIEARLSDSDTESDADNVEGDDMGSALATSSDDDVHFALSDDVRALFERQKRRTPSPLIRQPSSNMAVVLWQPQDEHFVQRIVNSANDDLDHQQQQDCLNEVTVREIGDDEDDDISAASTCSNAEYLVTFPSDYERKRALRTNSSTLKIEEITDNNNEHGEDEEMDIG